MWFGRKTSEAQLNSELRYHFEKLVCDFVAAGIPPEEARRRARLEFGGVEQIKEECRDVRGRWLEDLGKDLRYTVRTLRRSPGFLTVSVLSLALGIGANTAIFSLINAVMLRSLPVQEPERLVQITRLTPDGKPGVISYPLFQYFRDNLKSISASAVELSSTPAILLDGAEEVVEAEMVSGAHYSLLGLAPAAGRLLDATDDVIAPASPAAVNRLPVLAAALRPQPSRHRKNVHAAKQGIHHRRCHAPALPGNPARARPGHHLAPLHDAE